MDEQQTTARVDYVRLLRRVVLHRWRILVVTFLAVTVPVTAWVLFSTTPTYDASATLFMVPERQGPAFMRDFISPETNALYLAVLRSRSLAQAVVEALPKESRDELTNRVVFRDHLLSIMNYVRRLRGLEVIVYSPTEVAIRELQEARTTFDLAKDGTVTITATAFSPRVAVDLANTYVEVLLSRTSSTARDQNRATRELIERQLEQARTTQAEAEQALGKFQTAAGGTIKLPDEARVEITRLAQLETTLSDIQVSREIAQKRLVYLRGAEKGVELPGLPPATDPDGGVARDRLNRLEAKLSVITTRLTEVSGSAKYAESHPLVQAARAEVQEAQERFRAVVQSNQSPRPGGATPLRPLETAQLSKQMADLEVEIVSLQAREQSLQQRVALLRKSTGTMGAREQEYSTLARTVESQRNLSAMLAEKLTAAKINEQSQIRGIQVVDLAALPRQPSPKQPMRLMVLGLLGGLGLGLGLATVREHAHRVIETEEEAADVSGFDILGSIPVVPAARGRRGEGPLDFFGDSSALLLPADSCRMIRFALEPQDPDRPLLRTILVTSPGVHEGKTTVALNLGRAFSETNRRVLLVDADLRRPTLHSGLNLPNEVGLADWLHRADLETEPVYGNVPGLELLSAGTTPANPSALLSSSAARRAVELARERADVILIDSPPLLAVSDTLPLTGLVDGVVLVVRAGITERRELLRAKEQLDRVGARVVGLVVNGLSARDTRRYYGGYAAYAETAPRKRRKSRR